MRGRRACPGERELGRALQSGPDPALAAHLGACAGCAATWNGLERAIRIARTLPVRLPPQARRDEVRAALLAAAQSGQAGGARRRPPGVLWMAAAAAAAVAVWWVAHPRRAQIVPARTHATVRAAPGADYATASPPPQEALRLRAGTLDVEVDPLTAGERFRVVIGGAEVEVRGTAFRVTAASDRLVRVDVTRGRVEVRPGDGRVAVLGAGQVWRGVDPALAPAAAAAPETPPPARAERARAKPAQVARRRAPTAQEALYDDAWDAMRAADFGKAAALFASVTAMSPAGALADEGAFFHAVSLARAGRPSEAITAFRDMLAGYPASPRWAEASVMLGWLLVDARELDEAARRFGAAAADPSEAVRDSAGRGLQSIDARP